MNMTEAVIALDKLAGDNADTVAEQVLLARLLALGDRAVVDAYQRAMRRCGIWE